MQAVAIFDLVFLHFTSISIVTYLHKQFVNYLPDTEHVEVKYNKTIQEESEPAHIKKRVSI